jgi:hypothetical protein
MMVLRAAWMNAVPNKKAAKLPNFEFALTTMFAYGRKRALLVHSRVRFWHKADMA